MAVYTDNPAFAARFVGGPVGSDWSPVEDGELADLLGEFLRRPLLRRRPGPHGWTHLLLAETADRSNYDRLIELVRAGRILPDRLLCLAGSGRGFHGFKGRHWAAVPGNVHLSVHLAPQRAIERFEVAFMALAAVAVVEAIDRVSGIEQRPGIRWVNDIVFGPAKVGGVLAYTHARRTTVNAAILGIGVNVLTRPEVEPTPFVPSVTALAEHTRTAAATPEPDATVPLLATFLARLLDALDRNYRTLLDRGHRPIVEAYRSRSVVVGREVEIRAEDSDAEPRVMARGVVRAIGDGLELFLEGRNEPVTRGRIVVVDPPEPDPR